MLSALGDGCDGVAAPGCRSPAMGGITHVEGCGGVPAAGRAQPAGLHGGDALRLPHHRGSVRRPLELDGREGLRDDRRCVAARACARISDFKDFDLSFRAVARIDEAKCIKCNLCYVACNDTAHQCIDLIDATASGRAVFLRRPLERQTGGGRHAPAAARARRRLRRLPPVLQRLSGGRLHRDGGSAVRAASPVTWDQLVKIAARSHRGLGSDGGSIARRRASRFTRRYHMPLLIRNADIVTADSRDARRHLRRRRNDHAHRREPGRAARTPRSSTPPASWSFPASSIRTSTSICPSWRRSPRTRTRPAASRRWSAARRRTSKCAARRD